MFKSLLLIVAVLLLVVPSDGLRRRRRRATEEPEVAGPIKCPMVKPRSFAFTGCTIAAEGRRLVCGEKMPGVFSKYSKKEQFKVMERALQAEDGLPGSGCCLDLSSKIFCSSSSIGSHQEVRNTIRAMLEAGPKRVWKYVKELRMQGDDHARKVLRKINDYDLAAIAFMLLEKGDGIFDGDHDETGGEAFIFALTAKVRNVKAALQGKLTPRDAGSIDAIVGKLGGFGFVFELFPTLHRFITGKGGAGSPTIKLPKKAMAAYLKLLQAKPHDSYWQPTFLMEDRKFAPGDWKGYNAYVDAVTHSSQREGQAIPLYNGGYVPVKGRPVVRKEMLDASMGDHEARQINPGEKLKLEDPESCFPRAIKAIEACQPADPVYLSVFVFQSDEWAQTFARVLIDASKRGCDVQVIYDEVGSGLSDHHVDEDGSVEQLPTNPKIYQDMRDAGVPVIEWPAHSGKSDLISSHLNHRKILIVGGGPNRKEQAVGYAFLNVGTEYAALWTDFSWEFRGPILKDMMRMWVEQKNRVLSRVKPEALANMEGINAKYVFSRQSEMREWIKGVEDDWKTQRPAEHVYKNIRLVGHIGLEDIDIKTINIAAIKTSVKRVKVQCPYVTDDDFLEAMADAGRRFRKAGKPEGSVVLLVPDNSDMPMTKLALRTWYDYLLDSGVQIRLSTAPMMHGKAKLFDDTVEGGSSNLDTRSLWNNDENIGVVDSKELADDVDAALFNDPKDIIVTKEDVVRYKANKAQWVKSQMWRKLWLQL